MKKRLSFIIILFFIFSLVGCTLDQSSPSTPTDPIVDNDTNTDDDQVIDTDNGSTEESMLEIHFIDVGQADSIFFKLPNGEHMLIDAGNNNDSDLVKQYIINEGVSHIDYVLGTHPHEDHIGGLDVVITHFEIGEIYLPNKTATSQTYLDLLQAIDAKDLMVTAATKGLVLFNTTVEGKVLKAEMLSPSKVYSNTNDNSIVIKLTYGTTSYIFSGDAEDAAEHDMISGGLNLKADFLKVGHHGSSTSTTEAFLNQVQPDYAVISVGTGNTYGHPAQTTVDRLVNSGVELYRTDENGTIILVSNGTTITLTPEKIEGSIPSENPEEPIVEEPVDEESVWIGKLYINEFVPAPSSSSNSKEWIEIYNASNEDIDLSGFIIDDIEGGTSPITIPNGAIITAKGYYVHELSMLNNTGDDVRLIDSSGLIVDLFSYTSTSYDQSYYRLTDGGEWSSTMNSNPTPGTAN